MTHFGITMDNNIAMDIHCDITMGNDIAMCTYHGITMDNGCYEALLLRITTPNYDIAVSLVNSLKVYTNKINIQSIVVWHKNKNIRIIHSSYGVVKYR